MMPDLNSHPARQHWPNNVPQFLFESRDAQITLAIERYPLVQKIYNLATARNTPIYLVGGTVRDLLVGADTHDLDFAVKGDGLAWARYIADRLYGAYVALDRRRRMGRVVLKPRADEGRDPLARTLYLDVASLRGNDLTADLKDRDFTINAMAVERTPNGCWHIYDPLGGCEDLAKGVLRAASPSSFVDDPVRTLRAVRMCSQFGCTIEPQTRSALQAAASLLGQVSAERVRDEWFKILKLPGADNALSELHQLGLLSTIAPPMSKLDGLGQSAPHRADVLAHSFETVGAVERLWAAFCGEDLDPSLHVPDSLYAYAPQIRQRYERPICDERTYLALLKCGALLHDVGKADTETVTAEGQVRFIGHEGIGAEIAIRLGRQWRCSKPEVELLRTVVLNHMRPTWLAAQSSLTRRAIYRYFRDAGEYGIDAALVSLADYLATWGPRATAEGWKRQAETVSKLLAAYFERKQTVVEPPLLLSGRDLLELFELSPGPVIGQLLAQLREEQAAGEIHTRNEALDRVRQWIIEFGQTITDPFS